MLKRLYIFILLLFLSKNIISISELTYQITPIINETRVYLKIKLTFKADNKVNTKIFLPNTWAGERDFFEQIKNIKVETSNVIIKDTNKQEVKNIYHARNQVISLSYEVYNLEDQKFNRYRQYLTKDFMRFAGNWIFLEPENLEKNIKLNINLDNIPNSFFILSSFGIENNQKFFGNKQVFQDCFFVLANNNFSRLYKFFVKNNLVCLAINGKYKFTDKELVDSVQKIIACHRDFFNDHDFKFFGLNLITTPDTNTANNKTNNISSGGSGFYNFFDMASTDNVWLSDLEILCLHERFHTWNGTKINSSSDEIFYWFSEGFTEYYSLVNGFRSGIIKQENFADQINRWLVEYYTSPVINSPNIDIKNKFWADKDIQRLAYTRGFVFAVLLNSKIKKESNNKFNLDNLFLDLFNCCKNSSESFSDTLLDKLACKYINSGINLEILKYIELGKTIYLSSDAFDNFKLYYKFMGQYSMGFDFDQLIKTKIMPKVDPTSNAYVAGLREGQKVNGWSAHHRADKEVCIWIGKKEIKFLPQKPPFIKVAYIC